MIRFLITVCLLLLLLFAALWFAENEGTLSILWLGYQIETSIVFALASLILLLIIAVTFVESFLWIKKAPLALRRASEERKHVRGLAALTEGFVAVAAGDVSKAKMLSKKAESYLGSLPLTQLLSAQTAQATGDSIQATQQFTALLENKETEMIGLKGLLQQAREQGDLATALSLAEKLYDKNPKATWVIPILIDLYRRNKQWEKAQFFMEEALRQRLVDDKEAKRSLALIFLSYAKSAAETGDYTHASRHAGKALKALPDFIPAHVVLASTLRRSGHPRKAVSHIKKIWKEAPHPTLVDQFLKANAEQPKDKRLKSAENLFASNPDHPLSHVVLAETAFELGHYSKARNHLKIALAEMESKPLCELMLKIEEKEQSAEDVIKQWRKRANQAAEPSTWICNNCDFRAPEWDAFCKNCNSFDSLHWGQPQGQFVEALN